ncbi:plasmid mobilization relaxosome protein MobC [Paracoccus aurantiacus]|uniref:Plasmid mobilization relaxosome protein MobC n=1 Tax=Paracoccus aurantiacus TaxID=2599412 RepID=A0A5C6RQZ2_9RHOB|nr:plasmid mobilization relaxosome protein MobC [Paracoccus aurantiacus]
MIASGWQEVRSVLQNSRRANLSKGGQASRLTPTIRDQIVSRLKEGVAVAKIASEFDVAKSTIYRLRSATVAPKRPAFAPTEVVTFRISEGERAAFEEELARAGFKDRSDALRALVRNSVGLLDRNFAFVGEVKALYDEVSAIGVNVNQIARAVNRGQAPPLREAGKDLAELKSQLRKVLPALNNVVQEARRSNERVWAAARADDAAGEGESE